jgi:flavoprotein
LELTIRDIDVDNTNRLKKMKGIIVLEKPQEIKKVVAGYL